MCGIARAESAASAAISAQMRENDRYVSVVTAQPAGTFRRTAAERADQRVSWERSDQAFFASGACHILAWTCRRWHCDRTIRIAGMRFGGEPRAFHVYATWETWAFDHSGWNAETDLLTVNADFEGRLVERFEISSTLADFCAGHHHRMPGEYWHDPVPRASAYVDRHTPPWTSHGRGVPEVTR